MSNVKQQLISGATSGLTTTICLQPLDLLKTRVQQGDSARDTVSILRTTREIVSSNGILGLWRGTNASLVRNVPGVAIYMTLLTQLRTVMATSPYFAPVQVPSGYGGSSVLPKLSTQGNLLVGATARVAVGFILNPFSVLKARFESNMYTYESLSGAFLGLVRLGPSELLRGFTASALRDAPYAGLYLAFYEGIKREASIIVGTSHSGSQSALIHSLSAASASTLATMSTHPFDVIKTKVQLRSEDRYHGLLKTVKTIWQQRGLTGYFDGLSLRMSRKVLSSTIAWVVYEASLISFRAAKQRDM